MPSLRWLKRRGGPDVGRPVKLVVGLGNPGRQYVRSRHNIGFMVADEFARHARFEFSRRRFNAMLAEGLAAGDRVIVAKPQTFMNLSGEAVAKLYKFYRVTPENLLVIYDDLDLPVGKIRVRPKGSAGGHHGMESIIERIGTCDFPRLRIGIGRPDPDADIDHVLGAFSGEERTLLEQAIQQSVDAVVAWLSHGLSAAMNEFN